MVLEIDYLPHWIPEQMLPGTIFLLDPVGETGEADDPYRAVLACPCCSTVGLITRRQLAGLLPVICGSDRCSAQFFLRGDRIVPRPVS